MVADSLITNGEYTQMKKLILTLPLITLSACGGSSMIKEQNALYQTSINQYQNYNCLQVTAEMQRISNLIDQQTALLQKPEKEEGNEFLNTAVTVFAISRGYNFSQSQASDEERAVLNRLKSQYNSLDQMFIQKNCVSS